MSNKHYIYSWNLIDENGILHPFYIGAGHNTNNFLRSYITHFYGSQSLKCKSRSRKTRAQLKREKYSDIVFIKIEFDNLTLDERNNKEIQLISLYKIIDNGGCLYNHTQGGDYNPMFDPVVREKWNNIVKSEEFKQTHKNSVQTFCNDPEYREKQRENYKSRKINELGQFDSGKPIEELKHNMIICQPGRKEIEYQGIIYPSKKQLSKFLGISSQLLNFRLKNNIPLDLIPDKSNRPNKKIGLI